MNQIVRYTFGERVNHWIGAFSYTYLLMTGLAFWSPYLYWLAAVVGGGPTAALLASVVRIDFYGITFLDFHRVAWRYGNRRRRSRLGEGHSRATSRMRMTNYLRWDGSTTGRSFSSGESSTA